jgi:hypothetical protein
MEVDWEGPTFNLPQEQLAMFNERVAFQQSLWKDRIRDAEDDIWRNVLADVLRFLTEELSITDLRGRTIGARSFHQAKDLVETFNDEEIQEWKSGLQKGLKDNDWLDLVTHRTHHFVSGGQITFEHYDSENDKTRRISSSRDRVSSHGQPLNHDSTFSNQREEQAYRLDHMFLQPYRGEDVDNFGAALVTYNEMYDPKRYFGRCISIIQSSGTGKSRLVKELGSKVHHIFIVPQRLLSWTN